LVITNIFFYFQSEPDEAALGNLRDYNTDFIPKFIMVNLVSVAVQYFIIHASSKAKTLIILFLLGWWYVGEGAHQDWRCELHGIQTS
jgi:hypothetical protein